MCVTCIELGIWEGLSVSPSEGLSLTSPDVRAFLGR